MMDELVRRYPAQKGVVHPDPSGAARKTSSAVGQTDHAIIRQAGWQVYVMKPHQIVDRINAVNAMFHNANGERRLFIVQAGLMALIGFVAAIALPGRGGSQYAAYVPWLAAVMEVALELE